MLQYSQTNQKGVFQMTIPYGVCACLYSGIAHEIQYVEKHLNDKTKLFSILLIQLYIMNVIIHV